MSSSQVRGSCDFYRRSCAHSAKAQEYSAGAAAKASLSKRISATSASNIAPKQITQAACGNTAMHNELYTRI
eukprot:10018526-Karenia_brevis.AAC.1